MTFNQKYRGYGTRKGEGEGGNLHFIPELIQYHLLTLSHHIVLYELHRLLLI